MNMFRAMGDAKQWAAIVMGAVLASGALYFAVYKGLRERNAAALQRLEAITRENAALQSYQPRLPDLDRELEQTRSSLEQQNKVVPPDRELDAFLRMVDAEGSAAGIQIRRYTALPESPKDFFTEVPFEIEIDGPYYGVLDFFERLSRLQRIVNVSGLLLASTRKPSDAKAKRQYQYAPHETVVATCTLTTFFSHELLTPKTGLASPQKPGANPSGGRKS